MGYKNSPPYAQGQIGHILSPHRVYAKAYLDKLVIFPRTLEDHLAHLEARFSALSTYRIILRGDKSFIGYPSINLFGQRVYGFGLTTSTRAPGTLPRSHPNYAQLSEPLQRTKTFDLQRRLYVDIDTSKKCGIGTMVCHVKGDASMMCGP
jgi:hypothetical protein